MRALVQVDAGRAVELLVGEARARRRVLLAEAAAVAGCSSFRLLPLCEEAHAAGQGQAIVRS